MGFQKPPGTQDLLPETSQLWQQLEQTVHQVCQTSGFKEIRTPIFEATDLFRRGVGETTDIVEKEMYTFSDRSGRSMTLRPEGTAGVVRSYLENKLYGEADMAKLYYIGPMFRYERAQAGRYRQFHQFGVEAIGSADPGLDAEVIALGYRFFEKLGLKRIIVELNSVGTPKLRSIFRDKLLTFLSPMRSSLCEDCQTRMVRNPLRVLDCKVDQAKFAGAPEMIDDLDENCTAHFTAVCQYLTEMEIPYQINGRLVRGLDYYTHTAFEYKAHGIGAINTVGGGGRYNGLVTEMGGEDKPGIGFALGLERTLLLLSHQQVQPNPLPGIDIYFVSIGQKAQLILPPLVQKLRDAGIVAERDYLMRKTKAQFKAAKRLEAKLIGVLGEEELTRGEVSIRTSDGQHQRAIKLQNLTNELSDFLAQKKGDL